MQSQDQKKTVRTPSNGNSSNKMGTNNLKVEAPQVDNLLSEIDRLLRPKPPKTGGCGCGF